MAKYDLTLIFKRGIIKNLSELFDYDQYESRQLISVKDDELIQLVNEKKYRGYVNLSKEHYSDVILVEEMYPASTNDFFEKNKNETDLFNLHYTGDFGKSTVKAIMYYINDRYCNDLFVLEDKAGFIYPFADFIKVVDDFLR